MGFSRNTFFIVDSLRFSKKGVEIEHLIQTKYGGLKVADLVGKKFGTKVKNLIFECVI